MSYKNSRELSERCYVLQITFLFSDSLSPDSRESAATASTAKSVGLMVN